MKKLRSVVTYTTQLSEMSTSIMASSNLKNLETNLNEMLDLIHGSETDKKLEDFVDLSDLPLFSTNDCEEGSFSCDETRQLFFNDCLGNVGRGIVGWEIQLNACTGV